MTDRPSQRWEVESYASRGDDNESYYHARKMYCGQWHEIACTSAVLLASIIRLLEEDADD